MAVLDLKLLGGFVTLDGGGRPVMIAAKKNRALLAVLALAPNGAATREKLAGLLWSDRGPEQARSSFRQALVALRKEFSGLDPQPLTADDERVRLDPERIEVDAVKLAALSKSRSADELALAATLCTGPLLDGLLIRS